MHPLKLYWNLFINQIAKIKCFSFNALMSIFFEPYLRVSLSHESRAWSLTVPTFYVKIDVPLDLVDALQKEYETHVGPKLDGNTVIQDSIDQTFTIRRDHRYPTDLKWVSSATIETYEHYKPYFYKVISKRTICLYPKLFWVWHRRDFSGSHSGW